MQQTQSTIRPSRLRCTRDRIIALAEDFSSAVVAAPHSVKGRNSLPACHLCNPPAVRGTRRLGPVQQSFVIHSDRIPAYLFFHGFFCYTLAVCTEVQFPRKPISKHDFSEKNKVKHLSLIPVGWEHIRKF